MKRLLFIFTLTCIFSFSGLSQYYKFPFVGWKQAFKYSIGDFSGNFSSSIVESEVISDSLINGITYYKLQNSFGSRFLRSEDGKLFLLDQNFSTERVIMDFSLSVGDMFLFENPYVLTGVKVDTLFVLNKERILGPGQDSIYKMTLTKDLAFPNGGEIWFEGVGGLASGLIFGVPISETGFSLNLCTLNELNQAIFSTNILDCGCDKLYGFDHDRDGSRNQIGSIIQIELTEDNFGLDQKLGINKCDTLLITNQTDFSVLVFMDRNIVYPDAYGSQNIFDSMYFLNLELADSITITHQSLIHYTLDTRDCFENDCNDNNPNINNLQIELVYNGIDDDCNPETLDDDLDQDGFLQVDDCDDNNAGINPDAEEIPNNEIDENCDGMDETTSSYEIVDGIFRMYPNPASDFLILAFGEMLPYRVTVSDITGKTCFIMMENIEQVTSLPIELLENGMYIVTVDYIGQGKSSLLFSKG